MSQVNRKKMSISLSISPSTLIKLKTLEASGNFGSVSDIVYISICEFLGKIKVYEKRSDFDYDMLMTLEAKDNSPKGKISISLSTYIDDELKHLSKITGKSKSYIIRVSIDDFVYSYNNKDTEKAIEVSQMQETSLKEFQIYRTELKKMVKELLNEITEEKNNTLIE